MCTWSNAFDFSFYCFAFVRLCGGDPGCICCHCLVNLVIQGTVKRKQRSREQPGKHEEAIANRAGQILKTESIRVGRDFRGPLACYLSPVRGSSLLAGGVQTLLAPLQWWEGHHLWGNLCHHLETLSITALHNWNLLLAQILFLKQSGRDLIIQPHAAPLNIWGLLFIFPFSG